jgi:intracellular sulfur oxidation DsrE/DsrF family protein
MKRVMFLGTTALSAALPAIAGAADAIPGGTHLVERRADFDAPGFDRVLGRPAQYRLMWEAIAFVPTYLNNVKNALNGLQFGFGVDPAQIATAVAAHGPSSAYTYSDYLWQKYRIGDYFGIKDPATASVLTTNVFLAKRTTRDTLDPDEEHGPFQDASIEALQARGVTFLTCHTAVEEQARGIVKRGFAPTGMTPSDVAADMLTHLVPGAVVVPSMVAAIAVLQSRFHYAYLTIQ